MTPDPAEKAFHAALSEIGDEIREARAPEWPKPLYEHGGGRELSTKQWDHYKEPVVYVVPVSAHEIEPYRRIEALEAECDGLRKIIGRRERTIGIARGALSRVTAALRDAEIDHDWNAVASAAALAAAAADPLDASEAA